MRAVVAPVLSAGSVHEPRLYNVCYVASSGCFKPAFKLLLGRKLEC